MDLFFFFWRRRVSSFSRRFNLAGHIFGDTPALCSTPCSGNSEEWIILSLGGHSFESVLMGSYFAVLEPVVVLQAVVGCLCVALTLDIQMQSF